MRTYYPQLRIDINKLAENAAEMSAWLRSSGIDVHFVTKCFCAYPPILRALADVGVRRFADARLENLEKLKRYATSTLLLRLPMVSEAADVVCLADFSLNSELITIRALSDAALTQGRSHGVILMVELGDLREGILPSDVEETVGAVLDMKGVKLAGLGVNFNCFGGVIPSVEKMQQLVDIAHNIRARYGIALEYVSGGNSGSLHLLMDDKMPEGITHLRIGEGFLLGRETSFARQIPGMHTDAFRLSCEVVECKKKPSLPDGAQGVNAAGERPVFEDRGEIQRAILAIGGQDVAVSGLEPLREGVEFLGNSSDHSIFDVTQATPSVKVGEQLVFAPTYTALNRLFTSEYVQKRSVG